MTKSKIAALTIIAITLIIIVTVVIMHLSNPLRRSIERIRADMLELTPVGTSIEDVNKAIENNDKWRIFATYNSGYYIRNGIPRIADMHTNNNVHVIGVKTIQADIGTYNWLFIIFKRSVSVYYGFDKDSNLVDITVRKHSWDTL